MQSAQIPSERLMVVQINQAVPGTVGGRRIDSREADASDYLQDKDDERGAAEDVPPTRGAARDEMLADSAIVWLSCRRASSHRPTDLSALIILAAYPGLAIHRL